VGVTTSFLERNGLKRTRLHRNWNDVNCVPHEAKPEDIRKVSPKEHELAMERERAQFLRARAREAREAAAAEAAGATA
jgi:hypothetical protein